MAPFYFAFTIKKAPPRKVTEGLRVGGLIAPYFFALLATPPPEPADGAPPLLERLLVMMPALPTVSTLF